MADAVKPVFKSGGHGQHHLDWLAWPPGGGLEGVGLLSSTTEAWIPVGVTVCLAPKRWMPASMAAQWPVRRSLVGGADMEQAAELQGLGISVFSGADLERGVLEEMDRIIQQKEAEERRKATEKKLLAVRKDITAVKKKIERLEKSVSVHHLAASHHISPVLFTTRRDRDAKGGSDIPKPKETEEEMLIRTGEMTPFGSTSSRCAPQPSSRAAAELVCQVPPPRKRKKKECLGTVTRRHIPMASRNSRPEDEWVVDLEESDPEGSGQSDEEYLPESMGSDEDDTCDNIAGDRGIEGGVILTCVECLWLSHRRTKVFVDKITQELLVGGLRLM
ncbi:hypothetical protein MTO96_006178 [Rhipicephalus appendiculatus]